MEFQVHEAKDMMEIRLTGRLTFDDYDKFRAITAIAEGPRQTRLVLDVSGVDYIDSAGLGMFVVFKEAAERTNTPIFIGGAQGLVKKLMDLVNFHQVIPPMPL